MLKFLSETADISVKDPHIVRYGTHYSTVTVTLTIILLVYAIFKIVKYFKFGRNSRDGPSPKSIELLEITPRRSPTNRHTAESVHSDHETEVISSPSTRRNI